MSDSRRIDLIEREVFYPVARDRVWAALTEPSQILGWFDVRHCTIDLRIDGEIAFTFADNSGCRAIISGLELPRYLSWRWYPGSGEDLAKPLLDQGPHTLVEFTLSETTNGTLLKLVESGFAALTDERLAKAFRENTEGWIWCLESLGTWLSRTV